MNIPVSLISCIAMLLCTAAAVILAANQAFAPAVAALVAAILFYVLRLVVEVRGSRRNITPIRQYDRNAKYMRLCPRCGFIGSQRSAESVPHCPKCGSNLIATDTTITEYTGMTEKQRTAWKRRWL